MRRHFAAARTVAWMAAAILALSAGPAAAEIYNGDFEASPPLDGWDASAYDPPGSYAEGIFDTPTLSTVAHLHAETSYTYQSGSWFGQLQQAYVQQLLTLSAGQTHLRLDAKAVKQGLEVQDPTVTVIAAGGGGGCAVTSGQWSGYLFPLLDPIGDPLPGGTMVAVLVQVNANPPASGGAEGQQTSQVLDLYVDNVQLVPLPQTGWLLLAGAAAVCRKRRR
jgi:hypothetical protein